MGVRMPTMHQDGASAGSGPSPQSVKEEVKEEHTEEISRGRMRTRDEDTKDSVDGGDGSPEAEGSAGGPSRKRRRSRKGLDKKFDCSHPGCGKSYSRAEHLYRHQLNHNPKEIYKCDYPECTREFFRFDLCARHKERHTARGSQLQRKDAFLHNINTTPGARPATGHDPSFIANSPDTPHQMSHGQGLMNSNSPVPRSLYTSSPETLMNAISPTSATTSTMMGSTPSSGMGGAEFRPRPHPHASDGSINSPGSNMGRPESHHGFRADGGTVAYDPSGQPRDTSARPTSYGSNEDTRQYQNSPQTDSGGFVRPPLNTSMGTPGLRNLTLSSPHQPPPHHSPSLHGPSNGVGPGAAAVPSSSSYANAQATYLSQQNLAPFSLPPPGFGTSGQAITATTSTAAMIPIARGGRMTSTAGHQELQEQAFFDQMSQAYAVPMFGNGFADDGFNRSPFVMPDNFAAWLFSAEQQMQSASSAIRQGPGGALIGGADPMANPFQSSDPTADYALNGFFPQPLPQQHPMSVTSILDTSTPESVLSENKRHLLINVIIERFHETDHAPVSKSKAALLDGDRDDDNHVLSLRMMQHYITSYWFHFHPQLPILHKPTFLADETPNLLLIAMMSIGASCLDKVHGFEATQAGAELAKFLAWHIRLEIFGDKDFDPPAALWVFQTLLLLELYEKMYSTRALHERAHIHHATTITLMRRGSSLIGRSPLDSPPSLKDEKVGRGANGSRHTSGSNTPEKWWSDWIKSEATRRAAFAAFVIDSTHATMFGHNAVMVAHEMRLPLPCDEGLWSATSSAEVGRIDAGLQANGIRPVTFLSGLKQTLSGQNVRTNSFGRTILMAGLLSVSWHMNQRDLQANSLGAFSAHLGRDRWRSSLTRAFDIWKRDFDGSLAEAHTQPGPYYPSKELEEEIVFESRTVLHHLAHMAMHVDIVDCQIYAKASRLLGRSISPADYKSACRRMEDWAQKAKARDATFYSLRFLSEVLLNDRNKSWPHQQQQPMTLDASGRPFAPQRIVSDYTAREDCLLNRPWVLYFAALIVWSYGFTLEGPLKPAVDPTSPSTPTSAVAATFPPPLSTLAEQQLDMRRFLERVGRVRAPDELSEITGRNQCAGMLLVLRDMFRDTRWELLHEAGGLLTNCVDMLLDGGSMIT